MYKFISYCGRNCIEDFRPDDDKKSFNRNLRKQPTDWIYRTKEVNYSLNELGFRNNSFENINWNDSIVLFGCSFVFGVGLAYEDTIAYQLSSILNLNVVNLGVPGSGIDLACYNSLILHNFFPRPKAVVHIWSLISRYCDFIKHDSYGNETINGAQPYLPSLNGYTYTLNWDNRSRIYRMMDNAIWANKTQYVELSFFLDTALDFKIPALDMVDYARDLLHPGILSAKNAAMEIAKRIKM